MNHPYHVLFLCTGNSARSILAEALLNHLGCERFIAHSAGSQPAGTVNPYALALLERNGLAVDSLRSKSWDEFERPEAPTMDLIITVCNSAAGESCPVWPGRPVTAHWGIPDPAAVAGSHGDKQKAFAAAHDMLRHRISLLVNLPVTRLDRMSLQQELRHIHLSAPGHD